MNISRALLLIALFINGYCFAADHASANEAIFMMLETGASMQDEAHQADAINSIHHLLDQAAALSKRRKTRDTEIVIIASHKPHTILWSGTTKQLKMELHTVADLIEFHPKGFSDLSRAYQLVETTVNLRGLSKIKIINVGSFINIPYSKKGGNIVVNLPQEIPKDLALTRLAPKITSLTLLNVRSAQKVTLEYYLAQSGFLERKANGSMTLNVFGHAETKNNLNKLL